MNFEQPVSNLIKTRKSWRSYKNTTIDTDLWKRIKNDVTGEYKGPFENAVRLDIFGKKHIEENKNIALGTYGFVKNARYFLIGTVKPNDKALEDYGFCFERAILYLTGMGLGTCWLGATFKRSDFARAIHATEDEIIPAVSPFGHTTEQRSIRDRLIRMGAKSKKRKPWSELFFHHAMNTRLTKSDAGTYAVPLEMVRLAPSASNKQPWRIIKKEKAFHFFLQRHKTNHSTMVDFPRIDMGIAMCHFELTAREQGLSGKWVQARTDIEIENAEYKFTWIHQS
ncbi:nitroreductase [candidate division KSB1 bacterium]|nr:nitroreductase [candidate division KSB1 bacterium]